MFCWYWAGGGVMVGGGVGGSIDEYAVASLNACRVC
jgi:hypothetical protein